MTSYNSEATIYNSETKKGNYKIKFETDDYYFYKRVQDLIRELVDGNESGEEEIITSFESLFK